MSSRRLHEPNVIDRQQVIGVEPLLDLGALPDATNAKRSPGCAASQGDRPLPVVTATAAGIYTSLPGLERWPPS